MREREKESVLKTKKKYIRGHFRTHTNLSLG